jgi:hypothetical protein
MVTRWPLVSCLRVDDFVASNGVALLQPWQLAPTTQRSDEPVSRTSSKFCGLRGGVSDCGRGMTKRARVRSADADDAEVARVVLLVDDRRGARIARALALVRARVRVAVPAARERSVLRVLGRAGRGHAPAERHVHRLTWRRGHDRSSRGGDGRRQGEDGLHSGRRRR